MTRTELRRARVATAMLVGFMLLVALAAWTAAGNLVAFEACLDRGGAWSDVAERCFESIAERNAWEEGGAAAVEGAGAAAGAGTDDAAAPAGADDGRSSDGGSGDAEP